MAGRDQYMNFFTMQLTTGADGTTLTEEAFNTGAGVATLLAWRIHSVEWTTDVTSTGLSDAAGFQMAISTRRGLAAFPGLDDKGTIDQLQMNLNVYGAGTGHTQMYYPITHNWLPPMIVASPNFSLYWQADANAAGTQSKTVTARIGFTTEKLTDSAYREVFETWNYAN